MGCDIHAYLEYEVREDYWDCLISNAGSRDYTMFSIMAGVRGDGDDQVVPLKGMPGGKLSWQVKDAAYLVIAETPEQEQWDNYTSREQAERWREPIFEVDGREYCGHPDWHSHSWLTADELALCLGKYMTLGGDWPYNVEWDAILAAMRALEERGHKTRLTFWFDN